MEPYRRYAVETGTPLVGDSPSPPSPQALTDLGYDGDCDEELKEFFSSYGCEILFGRRHAAACGAWRSERIRRGDENLSRFANRVHVFQQAVQASDLDPDNQDEHYGRYLGYVSLRPPSDSGSYPYVAVAYIAPPRHMLRPRYHVILGTAGPSDGVLPFRCAPYCQPAGEDTEAGANGFQASCVHSAVHAALLLKMYPFGCVPISSQDMVAILWNQFVPQRSGAGMGTRAEAAPKPYETLQRLAQKGISLRQARSVLRDPAVRAGAIYEALETESVSQDRESVLLEAHRCMTDYLANGLPLILAVRRESPDAPDEETDGETGPEAPPQEVEAAGQSTREANHAVLVLGMHLLRDPEEPADLLNATDLDLKRLEFSELPGRFVLHDSLAGPYQEESAESLLQAAWIHSEEPGTGEGIYFLVVGPRGLRLGVRDARERTALRWIQRRDWIWPRYRDALGLTRSIPPMNEDQIRLVTRLLRTDQVLRRYGPRSQDARYGTVRQVLESSLGPGTPLNGQWWWSVEVRLPEIGERESSSVLAFPPALVCLWRIEDGPEERPAGAEELPRMILPRVRIEFAGLDPASGVFRAKISLGGAEEGDEYDWPFTYA